MATKTVPIQKKLQAVAITGMGIIGSFGVGVNTFKQALFHGLSHFDSIQYSELSFPVIAALIKNFSLIDEIKVYSLLAKQHDLIKKMSASIPMHIQTAVISTVEAIHQSSLYEILDSKHIGIIIAAQNANGNYLYNSYQKFIQNPSYLSPSYALHFMDSDYIGTLSEIFKIYGEGYTVGCATASGNCALLQGYRSIQQLNQQACIVVGAIADLSPIELQGFYNARALGGHHFKDNPNKACRPFDKAHDGFIYGQAAACIVLESLSSAQKRKVPILGYILGGAITLDGNRLTNPQAVGESRVMAEAVQSSGLNLEDINYINTHGTSAPLGDKTEIQAIESLFSKSLPNIVLNSTKSITGHCLWSAGVVEAIATIIQIQEKFVHPSLNLENPITNKSHFVIGHSTDYKINYALSNSFGFGGINTAIVLSNQLSARKEYEN